MLLRDLPWDIAILDARVSETAEIQFHSVHWQAMNCDVSKSSQISSYNGEQTHCQVSIDTPGISHNFTLIELICERVVIVGVHSYCWSTSLSGAVAIDSLETTTPTSCFFADSGAVQQVVSLSNVRQPN